MIAKITDGHRPGSVTLADGRGLIIARDDAEAEKIGRMLRDVIVLTPPPAVLIEDPSGMTGE